MNEFVDVLWGYRLEYPSEWVHRRIGKMEAFGAHADVLQPGYEGEKSGHLLVGAEWNAVREPIEPHWRNHIARVAGMIGAKEVGEAPWQMGGGLGFEAEIRMPKRDQTRLWTGVLGRGFTVLKFVVEHPLQNRDWFEPIVTNIITSLQFPAHVQGIDSTPEGLPLPPDVTPVNPQAIIPDITDPENWSAYQSYYSMGELQAFYVREASAFGWVVSEYVPFPDDSDLGFARMRLQKESQTLTLGILPEGKERVSVESPGRLVIKGGI